MTAAFAYPRPSKKGQTCAPYITRIPVDNRYVAIISTMAGFDDHPFNQSSISKIWVKSLSNLSDNLTRN
jgi:hypothetical protein